MDIEKFLVDHGADVNMTNGVSDQDYFCLHQHDFNPSEIIY